MMLFGDTLESYRKEALKTRQKSEESFKAMTSKGNLSRSFEQAFHHQETKECNISFSRKQGSCTDSSKKRVQIVGEKS